MKDTGMALEIEIFDGNKSVARGVFDQAKIIVGRISSADFRISDPRVSRIHALLERLEDGSLRLTDLASSHGTFVNGDRIVERIVSVKDEIKIAELKARLKFIPFEATAPGIAPTASPGQAALSSRPPPPRSESRVDLVMNPSGAASAVASIPKGATADKSPSAAKPAAPAPSGSREPTQIRSLKDIARTRGVLDPAGSAQDLEVTVYWDDQILHIDHYRRAESVITVGSDIHNTYIIPGEELTPRYDFIRVRGSSAELNLHPSMKGSARVQGKMQTLEELRKSGRSSLTLSGQDIAKVQIGTVNFFLMFVPEPPPIPAAPLFDQGKQFWQVQISVALAALLFVSLSFALRDPIQGTVKEFPEKYRKIIVEEYVKKMEKVKPPPPPPPKAPPKEVVPPPAAKEGKVAKEAVKPPDAIMKGPKGHSGGNEGEGAREKGAEGKRGWQDAKHETGITNRPKVADNRRNKVKDAQVKGRTDEKPSGDPAAAFLGALKNAAIGTKMANNGSGSGGGGGGKNGDAGASGNDPLDKPLLGVGGGGIHSGRGSGGSGLQGTGRGGGGTADGIGGLGTKGFGGGAKGDGNGSIPGKGDFAVGVESEGVRVAGSLSREEIERVVRAHKSEVDFCYSRELQRNPKLFGKLSVKWTIADGGAVISVTNLDNQTGSGNLADCIRGRIKDWVFPSPAAGSKADVEWTWSFKPSGT